MNLISVLSLPISYKEIITFLDIKVGLRNGKIITSFYVKPTDRHQYLYCLSVHPYHTKWSVVFTQTLPISRLCSYVVPRRTLDLNNGEMTKVMLANFKIKNHDINNNTKGLTLVLKHHQLL